MSPRTTEQYQEIRESKKSLIMEAALQLFAEEGYHATSISRITHKAGISKGLLYNYFDSKEELLREIVINGFNELIYFFDKNRDGILTNEEFEYFLRGTFDMIKQNMHFWKLYFSLLVQPPVLDLINQQLLDYFTPFFEIFSEFFITKGYTDPMTEVRLFAAIMDGIGMHYLLDPDNYPLEQSIARIIEIYTKK